MACNGSESRIEDCEVSKSLTSPLACGDPASSAAGVVCTISSMVYFEYSCIYCNITELIHFHMVQDDPAQNLIYDWPMRPMNSQKAFTRLLRAILKSASMGAMLPYVTMAGVMMMPSWLAVI